MTEEGPSGSSIGPDVDPSPRAPLVVAVSGTSGAGKTTLVRALAAAGNARSPGSAVTLRFDDYAAAADLPEADLPGWLARGGHVDEWRTPGFAAAIHAAVSHSTTGQRVLLIEEPFARARGAIGTQVDLAIHLRLDLHLALARRVLRDTPPPGATEEGDASRNFRKYLTRYLNGGGAAYAHIEAVALRSSDLVLDATRSPSALLADAMAVLEGNGRWPAVETP